VSARRTQLQYLSAVAEAGQITAAAKKLGLSQPTLSQGIAQLECELRVSLLVRHAQGVTLTPAGEAFLVKARAALAAETDAAQTGEALARAARGAMAVGFVGSPPAMNTPELFVAFAAEHPDTQIDFQDLSFPRGPTAAWLAGVDVAICHRPRSEAGVVIQPLRSEPRTVVARRDHPLAKCAEITADEALGETFVSFHPDVQPEWAGFHCLDDLRGARAQTTDHHALTSLQMLAIMSASEAITLVPERDARIVQQALADIVTLPLADVEPAVVSLAWRASNPNPLVFALVEAAQQIVGSAGGV